jgi:cell shape-determining protein MreC
LTENAKLEHALNLQSADMEKMIQEIDRLKPAQRDLQLMEDQLKDHNQILQETMILRQENADLKNQLQIAVTSPP